MAARIPNPAQLDTYTLQVRFPGISTSQFYGPMTLSQMCSWLETILSSSGPDSLWGHASMAVFLTEHAGRRTEQVVASAGAPNPAAQLLFRLNCAKVF